VTQQLRVERHILSGSSEWTDVDVKASGGTTVKCEHGQYGVVGLLSA
jgi:hypothetical protein